MTWPFYSGFTPYHLLHREIGRDPGTSTTRPSGIIVDVYFQTQPLRFFACEAKHVKPLWSREFHGTGRNIRVHIEYLHSPDTDPLHSFEIGCDSGMVNISIDPKPVNPGTRCIWGMYEIIP